MRVKETVTGVRKAREARDSRNNGEGARETSDTNKGTVSRFVVRRLDEESPRMEAYKQKEKGKLSYICLFEMRGFI